MIDDTGLPTSDPATNRQIKATITPRVTGDTTTGRLLGAQIIGMRGSEIAKRIDTYATALHHHMTIDAISDLDLPCTPPLGAPWYATQAATQTWTRTHQPTRASAV